MYGVPRSQKGREVVATLPHARRPRTSVTDGNISTVETLILEDRRSTVRDMGKELGISVGSNDQIIHEWLGTAKFTGWEVSTRLLQRYEEEGDKTRLRFTTIVRRVNARLWSGGRKTKARQLKRR
ncbi:hypothetical protein QE152_g15820 [Popillia japonica]|uniref:Uncharacterized protein n=1 Tax=Popillia japonica TaxID=7064 RepID=A0AAW1L8G7_POPJA